MVKGSNADHKDRRLILAVIGALLLLLGLAVGLIAPVEMYCFYLFSEGGRFQYEGFRFGSFMFGNIAGQIVGYYLIAALCIPLGYGHLRLRRWARTLVLTLCGCWLVVGAPLTLVFLFILFASKEISLVAALLAVLLVGASYPALPMLLRRFYQGRNVRLTFEARDPNPHWIERFPIPVLVLGFLFAFYAIVLHVPIFFNGLFPLFGTWLTDLPGIWASSVSIACLVGLTWGIFEQKAWAWWGSLVYLTLLTLSAVGTFATSRYLTLLSKMNLPPKEVDILDGLPLHGIHFAGFIGVPLVLTLGLLIRSKRHF
jgi:MFS family permease